MNCKLRMSSLGFYRPFASRVTRYRRSYRKYGLRRRRYGYARRRRTYYYYTVANVTEDGTQVERLPRPGFVKLTSKINPSNVLYIAKDKFDATQWSADDWVLQKFDAHKYAQYLASKRTSTSFRNIPVMEVD